MFIHHGSNINDQDEEGRTIFNWVIIRDVRTAEDRHYFYTYDAMKLQLINLLIDNGADVTLVDADGNDALKLALIRGLLDLMINRIIDAIKSKDENKNPSLDSSSFCNKDEAPAKSKLSQRTIQVINQKNKAGFTTLHLMLLSESSTNNTLLRTLLEIGADPNITCDGNGNNALHWVLNYCPVLHYFHLLPEYTQEAYTQVIDRYNHPIWPNISYSYSHNEANFDLLIEHDVEIHAVNKHGKTPFELALTNTDPLNLHILSRLIPMKQEIIDAINARGNGSFSILKLLLTKSMRNVIIQEFETFLDKLIGVGCNMNQLGLLCDAIRNHWFNYEMIKILVEKQIPITVQDIKESVHFGRLDVTLFLLNRIANDHDKVEEVRKNYPEILLQSTDLRRGSNMGDPQFNLLALVTLLLETYRIDVNYSTEGLFVLHNLVIGNPKDVIKIVEYLITRYPDLDINKKVRQCRSFLDPYSNSSGINRSKIATEPNNEFLNDICIKRRKIDQREPKTSINVGTNQKKNRKGIRSGSSC